MSTLRKFISLANSVEGIMGVFATASAIAAFMQFGFVGVTVIAFAYALYTTVIAFTSAALLWMR